jgi:hypothetical protein
MDLFMFLSFVFSKSEGTRVFTTSGSVASGTYWAIRIDNIFSAPECSIYQQTHCPFIILWEVSMGNPPQYYILTSCCTVLFNGYCRLCFRLRAALLCSFSLSFTTCFGLHDHLQALGYLFSYAWRILLRCFFSAFLFPHGHTPFVIFQAMPLLLSHFWRAIERPAVKVLLIMDILTRHFPS